MIPKTTKKKIKFLFDLDGTITTEELLPKLAKELGFFDEMKLLTKLTLNGDIPFDASFRLRVEILRQVEVERVKSIIQAVSISKEIVDFITSNQEHCAIVTNNLDVWVSDFCSELTPTYYTSKAKLEEGEVKGIQTILRKPDSLKDYKGYYTVAIGDGMNDAELLRQADFGIGYGGVHSIPQSLQEVAQAAVYDPGTLCNLLNQLLSHVLELAPALG